VHFCICSLLCNHTESFTFRSFIDANLYLRVLNYSVTVSMNNFILIILTFTCQTWANKSSSRYIMSSNSFGHPAPRKRLSILKPLLVLHFVSFTCYRSSISSGSSSFTGFSIWSLQIAQVILLRPGLTFF
jgi:hypothetical protein